MSSTFPADARVQSHNKDDARWQPVIGSVPSIVDAARTARPSGDAVRSTDQTSSSGDLVRLEDETSSGGDVRGGFAKVRGEDARMSSRTADARAESVRKTVANPVHVTASVDAVDRTIALAPCKVSVTAHPVMTSASDASARKAPAAAAFTPAYKAPALATTTDGIRVGMARLSTTRRPTLLYVDACNFGWSHFFTDRNNWSLKPVQNRVATLTAAAISSNFELVAFFDCARINKAPSKWRSRRLKEVRDGFREVPQCMNGLLGKMLVRHGIEVRYSLDADLNDTLAAHAYNDGAVVLSGDKDFFRYQIVRGNASVPVQLTLYKSFNIKKGKLILIPYAPAKLQFRHGSPLQLILPPPAFRIDDGGYRESLDAARCYRRGAPTPLIRELGWNPYVVVRPLRCEIYREWFGPNSAPIREIFPVWNKELEKPEFEDILVHVPETRNEELLELLKSPKEAFEKFFPLEFANQKPPNISSINWYKHIHGCRSIVLELCTLMGDKPGYPSSLLDEAIKAENDWKADV